MIIKNCKQSLSLLLSLVLIMGMIPCAVFSVSAEPNANSNPFTQNGLSNRNTIYNPFTNQKVTDKTLGLSAKNPFILNTTTDLRTLATIVNEGFDNNTRSATLGQADSYVKAPFTCSGYYFKLADNWSDSTTITTRIGAYEEIPQYYPKDPIIKNNPFSGIFDGNNKLLILGITVTDSRTALFGNVYNATIKNVKTAGTITVPTNINAVGGICGYAEFSKFDNCVNNCNITYNIDGLFTPADLYNVGGICGCSQIGNVFINCRNNGTISATKESVEYGNNIINVGGIVGDAVKTTMILNCYNTANISGKEQVGGIVGENKGDSIVKNCYSVGTANATSKVGQICGVNGHNDDTPNQDIIKYCYFISGVGNNTAVGQENAKSSVDHSTVTGLSKDKMIATNNAKGSLMRLLNNNLSNVQNELKESLNSSSYKLQTWVKGSDSSYEYPVFKSEKTSTNNTIGTSILNILSFFQPVIRSVLVAPFILSNIIHTHFSWYPVMFLRNALLRFLL